MRISLWILAEWLKKYHPVARIQQGERVLRNARLFSDELHFSRSTVYLEQIQSDRILCSSGHDYLILHGDDMNAVFNDILDAFEYYDSWSADANDLIDAGCTALELLKCGARVLRRLLILADAGFYMQEMVGSEVLAERFPASWQALQSRMLPHEALLAISRLGHIRTPEKPSYLIHPPGIQPGAAVTNLFDGPVHKGWLITVNSSGVYSRADLDLQDAFAEMLTRWLNKNALQQAHLDRSGIFLELLEHPDTAGARTEERLQLFGWYPPDRKLLYVLQVIRPEQDPMRALPRYLERVNPYAFLFRYDNTLVWIVNHQLTPPEQYREVLTETLTSCGYAAGKSREFSDFAHLGEEFRRAAIAARFAPKAPGSIFSFEEAALPYLAEVLRTGSSVDPCHPALEQLRQYDASHGASLTKTLSALLRNNCSFADTSAELFIHRSTLLYRLRRIQELTGIDLGDPDLRLYLQLSLLLQPE